MVTSTISHVLVPDNESNDLCGVRQHPSFERVPASPPCIVMDKKVKCLVSADDSGIKLSSVPETREYQESLHLDTVDYSELKRTLSSDDEILDNDGVIGSVVSQNKKCEEAKNEVERPMFCASREILHQNDEVLSRVQSDPEECECYGGVTEISEQKRDGCEKCYTHQERS